MNFISFKIPENTLSRVKRHDIIYGSPMCEPLAGFPIGDGDIGSLVWFEENGLHININKTDLWDDSTWDHEYISSEIHENLTCLRHGGELVIKFNSPCFDFTYQKEFEGRLKLSTASAEINSVTAFSDIKAKCFASNENKVTALKFKVITEEEECPEITLTRYGSKNSWRWYNFVSDKPEAGLGGTETKAENKKIFITQVLNGTIFSLGLSLIYNGDIAAKRINSHTSKMLLDSKKEQEFILYYNISLGESELDAENKCREILEKAENKGFDAIYEEHKKAWESFWNKSYINIPDDYLENLWYLSLYYSQSECRGAYAPHFTNGIWGFKHDFVPWNYYFHYNMQHMYAPLEASGHGDLVENYYRMRVEGLPVAYKFAQHKKNMKGAFYHDVTDYLGRCAEYDSDNCTPGSQIAMAMYRHYRMNGDENFLKNSALPVMKGVSEFYLDLLGEKEADGLYHVHGTTAYEGTPLFDDTITDTVMIKALFGVMVKLPDELVSESEKEIYRDVLNNLPDYLYTNLFEGEEYKDGKILLGIGKGREVKNGGEVLAIGKLKDKLVRRTFGNKERDWYGFPDTEISPVYPAGIIGIKDKGTRVFDAIMNSILIHSDHCSWWCMMPQYLARMGMSDMLFPYLRKVVNDWQTFPCGMGADSFIEEARNRFFFHHPICSGAAPIGDIKEPHTYLEGFYFRHLDMEFLPILASSLNEALLQSYDGIIRILPAMGKKQNAAFTLYAEGGFKVSCENRGGAFNASVENLRGENSFIKLPEFIDCENLKYYIENESGIKVFEPLYVKLGSEEVLELKGLSKGEKLIITNGISSSEEIYKSEENIFWKSCGEAFLGTPPLANMVIKYQKSQEDMLGIKDMVSEALSTQLTE
ncbi:MAG: hypothetical protein E7564_07405 [Ruminococcaceae bacterium]|nr:hypothetical protein [Oscillospiraceae bacterium]